jgi:deazaflavin-dependent oxidoreductase (nitroreductase family)
MPNLLPQIVAVDRTLERVSGGRLTLLDLAGLPNLVLTTTGRKSGEPRRTPLLCVPTPDAVLIAGSYFGGPKEPLWVANIEAHPHVTITMDGTTRRMAAQRLEDDARAAAWERMLRVWPNFARYEARTNRRIKVFALTPADEG